MTASVQHRVVFDFDIGFANGGGLQGQDFRLDIEGHAIDDADLAEYLIRDLRLLMVDSVRILNKRIIPEAHRRSGVRAMARGAGGGSGDLIDISHVIEDGLVTYRGLPAPMICDFLSREQSRSHYIDGTEFHIGRIDMVANTGTYLDSPFHRYADGIDIAELPLERLAGVPALCIDLRGMSRRAIDRPLLAPYDVHGRAVLIQTGWDRHWRSDAYFEGHPYLTAEAAHWLRDAGASLVGIDSLNIDDTGDLRRPTHTILLGAGIPIVEHLCGLQQLPAEGFAFSAVPAPVRAMGTFPVRAYARLDR